MNKLLLSAALIASIGAAALAPRTASAVDGVINITGSVTTSTCKINGNTPGASNNIAVTLPNVSSTSLNTLGAVAGTTAFNIVLSGCGSLTKATTYFEQGPTVLADGNLSNATGTATGVEVQLLNGDRSAIALNGATTAQNSKQITLTGAGNTGGTLPYFAQYYATNGTVGAGTVTTSVQFTMQYQ